MNRIAQGILVVAALLLPVAAQAALTVQPLTWNVIGLDSNSPATGPNSFPVGARVCSDVATTNVSVSFFWDSANPFINLRAGSLSTVILPSIGAGSCADAYFEVEVTRNAAAFDTTRRYHITATDLSGSASTPTPRELYVEHLISQSRNSISDVRYGTSILSLASVAPGGSMDLVVGNTYVIQLIGGTATQGYNQFEEFINFSNAVFQILDVDTTYSADNSPYVANPNDKLYADACGWENDPNSPNYRACVGGDFKAGGTNVVTTYTIKIISGGGTSQTLNTLLYDFSGSSFHYNADYDTSARVATVSDPSLATIAKNFNPDPATLNGVTALTFTLGNPNPGAVSGYNFVDNLPANLVVAATPNATTSGCGTPTLTAVAGSSTISFSNGTVAANGTCVITVNVTPTATGLLTNTTNNLFIGTLDTGKTATDTLTVNNQPPPPAPVCGIPVAAWLFPSGFNTSAPAPSTGSGTAAIGTGLTPISSTNSTTTADGTLSWGTNGNVTPGATLVTANDEYFEFAINTTGYSSISLTFDALKKTPNGPAGLAVYYGSSNTRPESGTAASAFNAAGTNALPAQNTWVSFGGANLTFTTGLNPSGTTYFRIYTFNSGNSNSGSDLNLDNVVFTGCITPVRPSMVKAFSPDPIAVGGTSTLTFTLANPNLFALTGAAFTDVLPTGVQVAATPAAATTCGGTWAPAAGSTTLTFSGGTIPSAGSCTVSVAVTAMTGGAHPNVSGYLSTTETGTSNGSVATDVLTAIAPPSIAKTFDASPILAGGVSTLTFIITNPNTDLPQSGVAFSDPFPAGLLVAPVPNATTSGCGAPTFSPSAGAGSVSFSGGTIAAGGTCVVTVDVTAASTGSYVNTTGNVSHIVNAQVVNGNAATDTLVVEPPSPSMSMLKQVGPTAAGPWTPFLATAAGSPVYYRFTIENTGDVALTNLQVNDDTLNVSSCNATLSGMTLPVPVAANENHIFQCVVGPIVALTGSHLNTADTTGTAGVTPVSSDESTATYATTGLTLDKTAVPITFTAAGDVINYSYLVTNSGFAPLEGPVTVTDDKATVTCPAVTTVGDLDNFLDPAESLTCTASYIITATDVTNTSVTNTATATVEGVNSNVDTATVTLTGSTSADVSVVKTLVTAGPYTIGQSISYTLFVANAGPSIATNVQVTDTPSNMTITNVSGGGCAALPCTIASLAVGANVTINVTATITAAGAFDNTTTVAATEPDPDPTDNTDNTGNGGTADASADVSVVKTLVTAGPFSAGQSISYTLLVANAGPSIATNVQVTDTPSNMTITNVSGGGCAALPCTIASLAVGANVTINVTATITASGAFDNTTTVAATEPDPDPTDNDDDTGNGGTADASADVSVVKTLVTAGPFSAGQSISYTLFVANAGPSIATNVQVTDTPSNMTITNVSGGGCAALPCTIASLAVGANVTINVTATITAAGAFDNTTTVAATEPDPDTTDNDDDTGNGGTAVASADVSVVKTLVTAGPFSAGQSISYTLFVANAGPSIATNVQVTDTPSNMTITNVSGGGCAALPCTIASLAVGANVTINVTATITAAGAFDNTTTVAATEPDPDPTDNTDNTGNGGTALASADLSVVKTLVTAGPFSAGQSISYTLVVANAGPSIATNVQVTDTPSNMTITNVSGGGCAALPCTIATLAVGANTTINVTATITASGAFDNTTTVAATEPDPDTTDNDDDTGNGGTALASADVSVVKTLVTAGPYSAGQSISYTLVVANAGPSIATNVQVTDTPSNMTITNVSGSGCAALPCTIASLAVGANTTINVTATITAPGAFDNTTTVTATEPDPDTTNNTDNTGNGGLTGISANVSMVKTLVTAGPFNPGQSISYTLVVTNAGPSPATNIQVTDTPSNLTITNVSNACVTLPCTIPTLAVGASATIDVTATIGAVGAFDNAATATATEPDPDTTDNTDDDGNGGTSEVSADVSIVKTLVTAGPYSAGQSLSYTLVVANAGPSIATNVQVTDTPSNMTITNVSGSGCAALPCTIPSLAVGANTTINVTATITAAGAFDNTTTVTATEPDPNTTNNTDDTGNGGLTGISANVSMVKTLVTAGPFLPGESIGYTLVVTNAGPSPATNVQVTDTPTNLTITNVSNACVTLPCTIPTLGVGASATIDVTATISAAGAFDNAATATATEPDPDPTDNTDDGGNGGTAIPSANVSIVKTLVTPGPFVPGQSVSYTLVVANAGPSTATTVQVTDTPSNLTITGVNGGGCTALPCTIAAIASGASVTINVTATINAAGAFENSASANAVEPDPDQTDNTDPTGNGGTAVPLPTSADVRITKTAAPAVAVGQAFDYTIGVINDGPATATNVTVTDVLPANFTLISAMSTQGTCSGTTTVTCTVGTMALSATATITIRGLATQPGSYANTATVTATEPDPTPTNNTSTVPVTAAGDIPTLDFYALLGLAVLLGVAGVLMRR